MGAESEGAPPAPATEETPKTAGMTGEPAPVRRLLRGLFASRCASEKEAVAGIARPPPASGTSVESAIVSGEPFRRLLPAALFLLTFVSVMTMLLIYMDNTAMGQQQFRQIMRQEDELANIAQDDEKLVEFMIQKVLISAAQPFPPHAQHKPPPSAHSINPTTIEQYVAQRLNYKRNGVFVELGAYGLGVDEKSRTEWLESKLGWHGLLVTPDARDYFRLRARRKAPDTFTAQACISTTTHPKEITYQESSFRDEVGVIGIGVLGGAAEEFSARVKCFPLYTFLLASQEPQIDFLSISCNGCELSAFKYLPQDGKVHISIIEIIGMPDEGLEELLATRGYTVSKRFTGSTIYTARDITILKI